MRNYFHVFTNLPGILARIERELEGKASKASVDALRYTVGKKADQYWVGDLVKTQIEKNNEFRERFADRPTLADLSQAKIDLGVRLDRLEAVIEKTGLADLATTLDQIAADQPEPGLRESIRETIAKAQDGLAARCASTDITPPAKKVRAPRKPKGSQ